MDSSDSATVTQSYRPKSKSPTPVSKSKSPTVQGSRKSSSSATSVSNPSGEETLPAEPVFSKTSPSVRQKSKSSSPSAPSSPSAASSSKKSKSKSPESFPSMSSVSPNDLDTSISPDRKQKQQKRKARNSPSPQGESPSRRANKKKLRLKSKSPQSEQTYMNQNNRTDDDNLMEGDPVLEYMNIEMDDDNCSTLTSINYQKEILEEAGMYNPNVDIQKLIDDDEKVEVTTDFKNWVIDANPITLDDLTEVYTYLFMKEDGIKKEKSLRAKKKNLSSELSGIKSIFKHMKLTNWALLYVTPTQYVHDLINNANSPEGKKDLFSKIATFPYKCQMMKDDLNILSSELKNKINPLIFQFADKVPKESIQVYRKWSGIYMRVCHEKSMNKVENAVYYDWDSIMETMPKLIKDKDPNMSQLQSWRDLVVLTLYKEYPARDNYGFLKLIKDSTKEDYSNIENYFLLDKQTFHISDYKKHRKAPAELKEPIIHKVTNETMDIINKYLAMFYHKNKKHPEYLITQDDGTVYGNGELSAMLTRMFQKYTNCYFVNIGVNELRHAKVAKHREDPIRKKRELAQKMRHSMQIHEQYSRESKHMITIPCGVLRGKPMKQPIPPEELEEKCSLEDYYKSNKLPEGCVNRYVVLKWKEKTLVGQIKKNKKVVFLARYKQPPIVLKSLSTTKIHILPKNYTPFLQKNVGKAIKNPLYNSKLEQNLDEKTKNEYPYVATYIDKNDTMKQLLIYDAKSILQS